MEEIAAVLVSAFDAHEMTVPEFTDALRLAQPELVQYIATMCSTASMMDFADEQRRREARLVCSCVALLSMSFN